MATEHEPERLGDILQRVLADMDPTTTPAPEPPGRDIEPPADLGDEPF